MHYAGGARLRSALATAHERAEHAALTSAPSGRVLEAQCLDMCLHAHDLHEALGLELDPVAAAPAAVAACRLVERVRAPAPGPHRRPRGLPAPRGARRSPTAPSSSTASCGWGRAAVPTAEVDADAEAFLLLLAGRRSAGQLADEGRVAWSGRSAESLVGV